MKATTQEYILVQQVQSPWHYEREQLDVEYVSRIKDTLFPD